MQKIYSLVILLSIIFSASAKEWVGTKSVSPQPATVELISSDISTTILKATVSGFFKSPVNTGTENAFTLTLSEAYPMLEKGVPDLLKLSSSIIIPDMANMKVEIVSSAYTEIQNISIAPSKGNLYRNINPDDVPFFYGSTYSQDAFYPGNLASLQSPYIFRDYRGQAVWFYPFQYNPVTKVLRVYSEIVIKVSETADKGENIFSRAKADTKVDLEFNEIYSKHFVNYQQLRYAPVDETGGMLIISYGTFMSAMQPLVDWKIRKGISVDMVSVTTAGGNSAAIKNYIVNYYNTHNLKYVLLVGDIAQIPTITASGGASDPSYGYIVGNDAYPEVFVGRFSAESVDDVNTQVLRTLNYERTPVATAPWSNGVCVASNQGPGDDNEMDWEHARVMRLKFLAFTYTNVNELYDGTHTGGPDLPGDPTPTDLFNDMQAGVSVINYTGHGSNTSFGTTGFSNSEIAQLTNYNILPFIWSVGCVNGEFDVTTCFAEAFLRAQVSGQPTGAVATFMSSINQSWSPPMDAQDEFVDLLVGTYATNIKRTFGGLNENGCMHMNDVYGAQGVEMTDTWHCFGDPSLTVRTATPTAITASHVPTLPLGSTQLSITCNTNGALACLSMNGQILGTGTVNSGNVIITFPSLTAVDTIFVTITGFNKIPYEGQVLIISASGPYVIHAASTIVDVTGNNNSLPDYSENITMNVTLQNVGAATANNVNAVISTTTPGITITDATNGFGNINATASSSVNNAFAYTVANNIADQLLVPFIITITDNASNSWSANVSHTMNAPLLSIGAMTINDATGNGNGLLDPGETATVTIVNTNNGHSASVAATSALTSTNPNVTITGSPASIGVLNVSASANAVFTVSLAPSMQIGSLFPLTITTTAGGYSATNTFTLTAGDVLETFESAMFTQNPWAMAGNLPWTISNSGSFQGVYHALSGAISDNQTSELKITINVLANDSISFYSNVSSEQDYDYLRFFIDAVELESWSGTVAWGYHSYPITVGNHTLRWVYQKDESVASGLDRGRVDNINFPPMDFPTAITPVNIAQHGINIYPNPSSSITTIVFDLGTQSNVSLKVYNSLGQEVSALISDSKLNEGTHSVTLDSRTLGKGIYFIRLIAGENVITNKFVVE